MAEQERADWATYGYPTTLIADRYSGTYSGGKWVAFPLDHDNIDPNVSGGDGDCMQFWAEVEEDSYGVGGSPQEALEDLQRRMAGKEDDDR